MLWFPKNTVMIALTNRRIWRRLMVVVLNVSKYEVQSCIAPGRKCNDLLEVVTAQYCVNVHSVEISHDAETHLRMRSANMVNSFNQMIFKLSL